MKMEVFNRSITQHPLEAGNNIFTGFNSIQNHSTSENVSSSMNNSAFALFHGSNGDAQRYGAILLQIDKIAVLVQITSIVLSIIGNFLVIVGTCNLRRLTLNKMVINYVAVCDLAYAFVQTLFVYRKLSGHRWHLGRVLCSVTVLSPCAISASFFVITFIAYERHRSIMHPLQLRFTRCQTQLFVVAIFVISMGLHIPYLMHMQVYSVGVGSEQFFDCACLWDDTNMARYWDLVVFVLTYPLPITVFLYCYARIIVRVSHRGHHFNTFRRHGSSGTTATASHTHNKKLCATLAAIVVVFLVTTSPNQILLLWKDFGDKTREDAVQTYVILYSLSTLVHLHSFANPVIYSLSDSKFRQVLRCHGALTFTSLRKTLILSLSRVHKPTEDATTVALTPSRDQHGEQLLRRRAPNLNGDRPRAILLKENTNGNGQFHLRQMTVQDTRM